MNENFSALLSGSDDTTTIITGNDRGSGNATFLPPGEHAVKVIKAELMTPTRSINEPAPLYQDTHKNLKVTFGNDDGIHVEFYKLRGFRYLVPEELTDAISAIGADLPTLKRLGLNKTEWNALKTPEARMNVCFKPAPVDNQDASKGSYAVFLGAENGKLIRIPSDKRTKVLTDKIGALGVNAGIMEPEDAINVTEFVKDIQGASVGIIIKANSRGLTRVEGTKPFDKVVQD